MAKDIRVVMKQFNGTSYDEIYPNASNGVMVQIIVTPISTLSSIKAISSNGTVFNGVFKSPNWIIEVNEYGNYTIEGVKTAGGTDSIELFVDECKQYEIAFLPQSDPILNNNSWEVIRAYSDAGKAESTWAVGDAKQITINGRVGNINISNLKINVFILGFNHNAELEGFNRIHFKIGNIGSTQVGLCDSNYGSYTSPSGAFTMNSSRTNSGGWNGSSMRKTLLGNDGNLTSPLANSLLAALPIDLRNVMKSITKYTDNTDNGVVPSNHITSTIDYLFLLAEFEFHGSQAYANSEEKNYQAQYDYYKVGNSKVHYKHNATSTVAKTWCRSKTSSYSTGFCYVGTSGNADNGHADYSWGVAPGFCV